MKRIKLLGALALILLVSSCGSKTPVNQQVKENQVTTQRTEKKMGTIKLTSQEFKSKVMDFSKETQWKFKGDKPAIIDFYATWCGPCKAAAPILEDIANQYAGKIDVYKIDVDEEQEVAAFFGIRSIPSILFVPKEGQPQMSIGALNKAQFEEIVKKDLLK